MTVLVAFLLAVLGCGLVGGRIVSKCELKNHLQKEIDNLPPKEKQALSGEILLAKLVCHADLASSLNTSEVKPLNSVTNDETLYGIFQFSNSVVCNDTITPSLNTCELYCTNFTDDDIRDDTICLLKILANIVNNGFEAQEEIQRMIRLILEPRCSEVPVLECS